MSGLKSRRKGQAGEYELRDKLRAMGYTCDRVPCSGAASGRDFKEDLVVRTPDTTLRVEVKRRKSSFGTLYKFVSPTAQYFRLQSGLLVRVSPIFSEIIKPGGFYTDTSDCQYTRKLTKLKEWLGTADILAVRDDHKHWIFIGYL